jgi:superfamily II DNA or RNA helicase
MQMFTDFGEYSYADKWDIREQAHIIYSGKEKNSDKQIIISTWESIYKLSKDYFNQFEVVICDEAHLAKANSLTSIMNKCTKARYKFGTTGTLDGTKTHKLVLEGLFGRVYKVVSTAELIDRGILSKMDIQCLMLYYSDEICKKMKKSEYQQEITFIVENEARNKFIRNLAVSLTGNTLVLFNLVERHGKILYNLIKEKVGSNRKVFFISGKVEGEIREEFRQITERETDAIIVASYGTFSYGVNIRNLHNVIIASPVKSIIRLLQSIGRGLRKVDGKTLKFFDISDILQYKSWKNHTMKHFMIRMDIYNKEKFNWKLFKIRLKDSSG